MSACCVESCSDAKHSCKRLKLPIAKRASQAVEASDRCVALVYGRTVMNAHLASAADVWLQVGMDGASFAKLCRDSGLLGGKLNTTAVDIAFSKAKAKVLLIAYLMHAHVTSRPASGP